MRGGVKAVALEDGANIMFVDGFTESSGEGLPKFVTGVFNMSSGAAVCLGDGGVPLTVDHAFQDGGLDVGEVFAGLLLDDVINGVKDTLPIHIESTYLLKFARHFPPKSDFLGK